MRLLLLATLAVSVARTKSNEYPHNGRNRGLHVSMDDDSIIQDKKLKQSPDRHPEKDLKMHVSKSKATKSKSKGGSPKHEKSSKSIKGSSRSTTAKTTFSGSTSGSASFQHSGSASASVPRSPSLATRKPTRRPVARTATPTLSMITSAPVPTSEPTVTPEPPSVTTEHSTESPSTLSPTASLATNAPSSSDPCFNIRGTLEDCFASLSEAAAEECNSCVVDNIPVNSTDCTEFESGVCTALVSECTTCAGCTRTVETFLNCAFQESVGCQVSCDLSPTASR